MKNEQFSSLKTIDKATIVFFCFGIPIFVGFLLPTPMLPEEVHHIQLLDATITVAIGVFVWGIFGLIEPRRGGQKWMKVKFVGVPIVWLLLILPLAIWFHHLHEADLNSMMFINN